jgi:aspartate kinase
LQISDCRFRIADFGLQKSGERIVAQFGLVRINPRSAIRNRQIRNWTMIIMKFGGTSVEDAPSIERVVEIIRVRLELNPVVVVSAMGKTTRGLLEAAEASAAGGADKSLSILARLQGNHRDVAERLAHRNSEGSIFRRIEEYFTELTKLLEGLAVLGEVPPRGLDKILSYGELLSSAILAHSLNQRDVSSSLLDARELIKTDDSYGGASPIFKLTNPKIRGTITPLVEQGMVPVVQGFIGSTRSGATTTLGFEGSDYTAAILGAALSAADIQIWKDVSGLMTADPAIFPGARTVKACTYAEAAELTYFGAKVLHPKAIYPAARSHIPIHIYNSRQPAATGTAITDGLVECSNPVKSIAYRRPVTMVKATQDPAHARRPGAGRDDFPKQLLDGIRRQGANPFITALSSSSVTLAVESHGLDDEKLRDLIQDLSSFASASVEENRALVTLVGEGLRRDPKLISRLLHAIDDFELGAVLHGLSPIMINCIIAERDVENVVARLHQVCFEKVDPQVFE